MTSTLDKIEETNRSILKDLARQDREVSILLTFGLPFLSAPFMVAAFMFIPLLGQLLAIGCIAVSIGYCRARRSWRHFFVGSLGIISSVVALSLLSTFFSAQLFFGGYILMGFASAVTIAYIVGVSGAIWTFYEKGAESGQKI